MASVRTLRGTKDKSFTVRYVGFVLVPIAEEKEITRAAKIFYSNCKNTIENSTPVLCKLVTNGLLICGRHFGAHSILRTTTDQSQPKLVYFTHRPSGCRLECHVLLCDSKSEAKNLCRLLRGVSIHNSGSSSKNSLAIVHNNDRQDLQKTRFHKPKLNHMLRHLKSTNHYQKL